MDSPGQQAEPVPAGIAAPPAVGEPPRNAWATLLFYGGLYGALWSNSVTRELQFKLNFGLWIVVELLWFALQLAFMSVLYTHTDSIGGWSRWEVILLVGCANFVQQLFTAFFLTNLTDLSEHIRTGRLDFLLLLPANTRFLVSLRKVDLGAFINAAAAFAVMVHAVRQLGLHPTTGQILGFSLLCGVGLSIHYSLMFLLATIAFWTVRAQGIVWGYYNLFNIARLPESAFPQGLFRRVFTFVLPMLLVANVPSKVLLQRLGSPIEWLVLVLVGASCFVASELFWRRSLCHYTSASS